VAALGAVLLVLGGTGGLASVAPAVFDPGALVRFGLPIARALHDLAAAVTVGVLMTAAWFMAPTTGVRGGELEGPQRWLVNAATSAAVTWFGSAVAVVLLTAADVTATPVGAPGYGSVLLSFVSQVDVGRALGVSALVISLVLNLTILATRVETVAWAAVLAVVALLPLALGGHASGAADHMNSVDSLALHLVSVCVWVGGLAALLLVAGQLGSRLPLVAARYSTVAGWCFVVVAGSGLVNAWLRLGSMRALGTTYGMLVVLKVVALAMLGLVGWTHRRITLRRVGHDRYWFARLASGELVVMGATIGLAVALSRTAAPGGEAPGDPVSVLLGYPAPAPVNVHRFLTVFHPDLLWLCVAVVLLSLYLTGVVVLHRRGDRWPVPRTALWVLGCGMLVFATSGGLGVYGRIHFSSHLLQHMTLMIVIPSCWVMGAPVTLALRALPRRRDGSFGARDMLLQLVHSRALSVLGQPLVATALFTAGLAVFYSTELFELAMFTHPGHVLMTAHFLLSGYLFVWSLVGLDPGPARPAGPYRMLLLLVVLAFHAFFGIFLMASGTLLASNWWHALGQTDGAALLADQQAAGAIVWAAGGIPLLMLGVALVVAWVRSDARRGGLLDRQTHRDGDEELRGDNAGAAPMFHRDGPSQ
jgi:putative copper resistance protein D